jgi:hypothetical protein
MAEMNDMVKIEKQHPNLFDYATKELSQDAFICWLSDWANPGFKLRNLKLHECGQEFIKALLGTNMPIQSVRIEKQFENIDVMLVINEEKTDLRHLLVIEDKTDTDLHGDQESRYPKELGNNSMYGSFEKTFVYFKTGNQSDLSKVDKAKWRPFLRQNILDVLCKYKEDHPILTDFFHHLQERENKFVSWKNTPLSEWKGGDPWEGFYSMLQKEMGDGNYFNVSNAKGGFTGFAFGSFKIEDYNIYFQFDQTSDLFMRISGDEANIKDVCNRVREKLLMFGYGEQTGDVKMEKARTRKGKTMRVAVIKDFIVRNKMDEVELDATVIKLKKLLEPLGKVFK